MTLINTAGMSSSEIAQALQQLKTGEKIIYFSGFLDKASRRAGGPAMMARKLADEKKVHLTQKRKSPPYKEGTVDWHGGVGTGFDYIATGA